MSDEEFAARIVGYRPLLLRVAARVVGSADAEDVAGEALLLAWRGRGTWDGRNLGAWLATVARNQGVSALRRRAARPATVPLWAGLVGADTPERAYLAAERDAAIRLAVLALPPGQRRVVQGFYFTGLATATLAALAGCPPSTTRVQMHKGRARLRRELAAWA